MSLRFWTRATLLVCLCFSAPVALARPNDRVKITSVADYRKCTENTGAEWCLAGLDKLVRSRPTQAFEAGKAVRATMNHWVAIPYFAKAFAKKGDHRRCTDEDVTLALISGLSLPTSHNVASASRTILFDRCWGETHELVLGAMTKTGNASMLQNLCPTLIKRQESVPACERKTPPKR